MRVSLIITAVASILAAASAAAQDTTATSSAATEQVQQQDEAQPAAAEETAAPGDAAKQAEVTTESSQEPAVVTPAESSESSESSGSTEEKKSATASQTVLSSDRPPPESGRPFYLRGTMQLRTLAISDKDPAGDRSMWYGIEAGYKIMEGLTAHLRLGLQQLFVTPSNSLENIAPENQRFVSQGERDAIITSPFRIRDTGIGVAYRHSLDTGWDDRKLSLSHSFNLFLPTSIASQDRGLYFTPELASRARLELVKNLTVGIDLGLQQRLYKYAQQFGPDGGTLTQTQIGGALVLEYLIFDLEEWGSLDAGFDLGWTYQHTYAGLADESRWRQQYNWDVSAFYTPRAWLSLGISLEQGSPVVSPEGRGPDLFNRDELELAFTVIGTY